MHPSKEPTKITRRGLWSFIALSLSGLLVAILGFVFTKFFSFPLRNKKRAIEDADLGETVVEVGNSYEFEKGGPPQKADVILGKVKNAWLAEKNSKVGSVWIQRDKGGVLHGFSSVCPHLGCSVHFEKQKESYVCPCHDSLYNLSGQKIKGPAKRGLDSLVVFEKDGRVKVKFEKYVLNIAEKKLA